MRIFRCNFAKFSRGHPPDPRRMVVPSALPLRLICDVTRLWRNLAPPSEIFCVRRWAYDHLNFAKNICINYHSWKLVLFNFRGDNARVFQRVSMYLNMTVGQAACQLLCRYTQSTLAVFAESYRLLRVTLSKELVAFHVWNAPDQWHNWQVAGPLPN